MPENNKKMKVSHLAGLYFVDLIIGSMLAVPLGSAWLRVFSKDINGMQGILHWIGTMGFHLVYGVLFYATVFLYRLIPNQKIFFLPTLMFSFYFVFHLAVYTLIETTIEHEFISMFFAASISSMVMFFLNQHLIKRMSSE